MQTSEQPVSGVFKPGKAIVDSRHRFQGVVIMDPALAQQRCDEKNAALHELHTEFVGDAYELTDCMVEVVG